MFASGNGLSISHDRAETIFTYYPNGNSVSYGAVTGVATLGEHIWIATAYDTLVQEGSYYTDYPKGNGISYSPDGGLSWQRFPQSVDRQEDNFELLFGDTIPALPITSRINNLTYDLAVQLTAAGDTVLWSVNFAGGCRRSFDKGESWERVILPPDRYDVLDESTPRDFDLSPTSGALGYESNLNHRAFSVHVSGDTVIVGTANGINISHDGGTVWNKYTAQNSGICGNFIVDVTLGDDGSVYGAALATQGSESQGLVVSQRNVNGMLYWDTYLSGSRLYNVFAGPGGRVFAAGEKGVWYSADGWNWYRMNDIEDENGQLLLTQKIYCALEDDQGMLWVGTADGVARSADLGLSWEIIRRVNADYRDPLEISAYPNPFSPSRMNQLYDDGYVRIHCHVPSAGQLDIDVYDFGMTRVRNIAARMEVDVQDIEVTWNGKNGMNQIVANGVYFIRLTFHDGTQDHVAWSKIIILD
ncbi:MAG: hypothetical protein JXR21_02845 [Candidatus Marinimicrobia bacterium]|nr:hypothetical protein [Candidatus Neomarinimicrobiota bacterium]